MMIASSFSLNQLYHYAKKHSVTSDSRKVEKEGIFVAVRGHQIDGSHYIESAIQKGAKVIICDHLPANAEHFPQVHFFVDPEPRSLLSKLAALRFPKQPSVMVAVTGTNGKTSTVHFCRQLWEKLGYNAASLGTLGCIKTREETSKENASSLTTPDPVTLHYLLNTLTEQGVSHVAMEASSHGLEQHRLDEVKVQAAAFTNLSQDHLDYHHSMEAYLAAKSLLFTKILPEAGQAVINADIGATATHLLHLAEIRKQSILTYGRQASETGLQLLSLRPLINGQLLKLRYQGKEAECELNLVGEFQAYNMLAAMGLVLVTGGDFEAMLPYISQIHSVPGRMEKVHSLDPSKHIYVDYAHTPDGIEKALRALRPHTQGKLWIVFGCGGDRDNTKRPIMGKIAEELADHLIITDDNPRTENPANIRAMIFQGLQQPKQALEIADRAEAITHAVHHLKKEDILLIAGKGHEKTQIIGLESIPFDDVMIAKQAIL